ncbi:hypothetical protein BDZ91DRAFT_272397 [Kalaharituber pfeilii]|nr:hypothetical protein BDZ91DRAFT_272397 [Kalaharituber pfeilii]
MINFEWWLGDWLFIKREELSGEAYLGMQLACEFTEKDGEMECSTMPNELYINPSWGKVLLLSINGQTIILFLQEYNADTPIAF